MNINKRMNDLSNRQFGKLKVLSLHSVVPAGKGRNRVRWNCICECGVEKNILSTNLLSGNTNSCGCSKFDYIKDFNTEHLTKAYFSSLKKNALRRNIYFNITPEYLFDLFIKQDKKCALSGIDIFMPMITLNKGKPLASVDRIDSSLGYIEGNIQWVYSIVNKMKMDLNQDLFLDLCEKITNKK